MQVRSSVFSGAPVLAALAAGIRFAKQEMGLGDPRWVLPDSGLGRRLLAQLPELLAIGAALPGGSLVAVAHKDVDVINGKLAERGFSIQLREDRTAPFYACGILQILSNWFCTDNFKELEMRGAFGGLQLRSGRRVPGVEAGSQNLLHLKDRRGVRLRLDHEGPFANCSVWLIPFDGPDESPLALLQQAVLAHRGGNFDKEKRVAFPMVDMLHTRQIDEIMGATLTDGSRRVTSIGQAMQQTRLSMDQYGFRMTSGAAYSPSRDIAPPFRINGPFALGVTVRIGGRELVLGTAAIGEESMRDPKRNDPLRVEGNDGFTFEGVDLSKTLALPTPEIVAAAKSPTPADSPASVRPPRPQMVPSATEAPSGILFL